MFTGIMIGTPDRATSNATPWSSRQRAVPPDQQGERRLVPGLGEALQQQPVRGFAGRVFAEPAEDLTDEPL